MVYSLLPRYYTVNIRKRCAILVYFTNIADGLGDVVCGCCATRRSIVRLCTLLSINVLSVNVTKVKRTLDGKVDGEHH